MASFLRFLFWLCVNCVLILGIIGSLEYFRIWSIQEHWALFFGDAEQSPQTTYEDPRLLKREELAKREESLTIREQALRVREAALQEAQKHHQELIIHLKQKSQELHNKLEKLQEQSKSKQNARIQLQDIAQKLTSMPPASAVRILEGLDTLLVIDILHQIDHDATLRGEDSSSPFLLSQMKVQKVQEIIRLKDKFPSQEKDASAASKK